MKDSEVTVVIEIKNFVQKEVSGNERILSLCVDFLQDVLNAEAPKERTVGASKAQRSLNPCTFTKDMLKNIQVSMAELNLYNVFHDCLGMKFFTSMVSSCLVQHIVLQSVLVKRLLTLTYCRFWDRWITSS